MSRNLFYKSVFAILLWSVSSSAVIHPVEKDEKEILTIGDKRRTYYQLHRAPLNFEVNGPKRLEILCRRAVPGKEDKTWKFGYRLIVDDQEPVIVRHEGVKSKGVKSSQHPGHAYTRSGKHIIKLPKGSHKVRLEPLKKNSPPMLIRVLSRKMEKSGEVGKLIIPEDGLTPVHVKVGDKSIRYYELSGEEEITVTATGPGRLDILNRLVFEDWMTGEQPYRIRITEDGQVIGTYFFTSQRSEVSTVTEDKTVVPGKWRSCDIKVDEGIHQYKITLLNKGIKVYIRPLEYRE